MARNIDRDEREMKRRKLQLIEAGFKLFSEKGIESVSLSSVSEKAEVGAATLYNYYQNKINLLVAISAHIWGQVLDEAINNIGRSEIDRMDAHEYMEFYCDIIISIYKTRPELLRFSADYKTFICRENVGRETVKEQLDVLAPISEGFHEKYEAAKVQGNIRTNVSEEELFSTVTLTMLGMAERFTQGLVWTMRDDKDYLNQLTHVKEMLLDWLKG